MITASTCLYCVLGNPVGHSLSPLIHNGALKENKINGVYLAFEPKNIEEAVGSIRSLGIRGASITIPFKTSIIPYLDWVDPMAKTIGAVNTVVNEKGRLMGYNTDSQAAISPLLAHGIQDKTICIVGAGGAARAVAHGILKQGGDLIITNRSRDNGMDLASQVSGRFISMEKMDTIEADVVINTTSVGMAPKFDALSFPAQALHPGMIVMDVVYTPLETKLLAAARKKGCITIDGLAMFLAQASAQFELWTGITPDPETMRNSVLSTPVVKENI